MARSIEMTGETVDEAVQKALDELVLTRDDVKVDVLEEPDEGGFLGFGRKPAKVLVTEREVDLQTAIPDRDDVDTEAYMAGMEEARQQDARSNDDRDAAPAEDTAEAAPARDTDEPVDPETLIEASPTAVDKDAEPLELDEIVEKVREFLSIIQESMRVDNDLKVWLDGKRLMIDIDGPDCGILIGRRGDTLRSIQYLTSLYVNRMAGTRVEMRMDIGSYKKRRENSVADLATRTAQKAIRTGNAYELNPMGSNDRRIVHETLADFDGIVTYSEGDEPKRYVVIDLEAAMPDDYDVEASSPVVGDDADLSDDEG